MQHQLESQPSFEREPRPRHSKAARSPAATAPAPTPSTADHYRRCGDVARTIAIGGVGAIWIGSRSNYASAQCKNGCRGDHYTHGNHNEDPPYGFLTVNRPASRPNCGGLRAAVIGLTPRLHISSHRCWQPEPSRLPVGRAVICDGPSGPLEALLRPRFGNKLMARSMLGDS
jgi:hypothetical protein